MEHTKGKITLREGTEKEREGGRGDMEDTEGR